MTKSADVLVRRAGNHPVIENGARVGYALTGVIHLVIAYLALKIAWSSSGANASQSGALSTIARQPFGQVVLIAMAVGFLALALFYVTDGIAGHIGGDSAFDRAKSIGKAVFYMALAYTAFAFTQGGGKSSSSSTVDVTATLMKAPGGRFIVAGIGAAVVVGGGYHAYKGLTRRFRRDLEDRPGTWAVLAGTYGYTAKGIALAVVGVLFLVAAAQHQPKEAKGLDGALHRLVQQPFGPYLLTLIALGFAAFGLYCFSRARHMRT